MTSMDKCTESSLMPPALARWSLVALRQGSVGCGAMAMELGWMKRRRVGSSSTAARQTLHKCPCHLDPRLFSCGFQWVNSSSGTGEGGGGGGGDGDGGGGGTAGRKAGSPIPVPSAKASHRRLPASNRRILPSSRCPLYAAMVASAARRRHSYLCPRNAVVGSDDGGPYHLQQRKGGEKTLQWSPSFGGVLAKHESRFIPR